MKTVRRAIGCAAAIVFAIAAIAEAQTVYVAKGTPGSTLEVTLNGAKVGSAKIDDTGVAAVDVNLASRGGKKQMDVRIAVESCSDLVRVAIAEVGAQAPPTAECSHTDIAGVYVMRDVTSFVVDFSQSTPTVWLRQGTPPTTWLHPELVTSDEKTWGPLPKGLIVSAGAGLDTFANATVLACGQVTCNTAGKQTLAVGGSFWLTRAFAVDVNFVKPADFTTSGSDTGYTFTSTFQTMLVTIGAKAGATAGPVRIYGFGGAAYHRVAFTTSQNIASSTVTVNNVTTTVPGGTVTSGMNVRDWSWIGGGGLEVWVKGPIALYAEGAYAPLKGSDTRGGEGQLDDHVLYGVGGVRVHLWR